MTEKVGEDGHVLLNRHAIVTFAIDGIMDLQLDGFNVQNVIGGLILRRAPGHPERRACLALAPSPQDIEIELEPCYGLDGRIRARSVAITFQPGLPDASGRFVRGMPPRVSAAGLRGPPWIGSFWVSRPSIQNELSQANHSKRTAGTRAPVLPS